jgi:hypothetical protein
MNMDKNVINEMAKLRSLMERVGSHGTGRQGMLNEQSHLNEAVVRQVETPDKVFDILNDIGRNNFVCVGIVTGANLELPKTKRVNPETNRMKSYDDYEAFGKQIGSEEDIAALVKISSYNFRYYPANDINKQYSDYKNSFNDIRSEYGLEPVQDKENDYKQKMNYGNGVNVYGGDDESKQGNFYVAFNGYNVKPKGIVYAINAEGRIVQGLSDEQVLPFLKQKDPYAAYSGVSALRKMGVEEKRVEEYVEKIKSLKFSYKQFEGNSILWIAATVGGQKIVYINHNLNKVINDIHVNVDDFVAKAKERYNVEMSNLA